MDGHELVILVVEYRRSAKRIGDLVYQIVTNRIGLNVVAEVRDGCYLANGIGYGIKSEIGIVVEMNSIPGRINHLCHVDSV